MTALRYIRVAVKAKVGKKALFVAVSSSISAALLAHAGSYAGSPVDFNTFKGLVATLTSWQAQARGRVPGAAAQRDAALTVVATSLELIRAFVEQLCNASPEQAATLAQQAGMSIPTRAPRAKVPLRARQGDQPGTVILYASVSLLAIGKGGRFFSWESSVDGGKTWVSPAKARRCPATVAAHVVGLAVMKHPERARLRQRARRACLRAPARAALPG